MPRGPLPNSSTIGTLQAAHPSAHVPLQGRNGDKEKIQRRPFNLGIDCYLRNTDSLHYWIGLNLPEWIKHSFSPLIQRAEPLKETRSGAKN